MTITIIVMCAQCRIQYLMTIYPPLILPLPIKPTKKHKISNGNQHKIQKSIKFLVMINAPGQWSLVTNGVII